MCKKLLNTHPEYTLTLALSKAVAYDGPQLLNPSVKHSIRLLI